MGARIRDASVFILAPIFRGNAKDISPICSLCVFFRVSYDPMQVRETRMKESVSERKVK